MKTIFLSLIAAVAIGGQKMPGSTRPAREPLAIGTNPGTERRYVVPALRPAAVMTDVPLYTA